MCEENIDMLNLSLDDEEHLDENQNLSKKKDFQTRKLETKLKKYEMILKNVEKIERVVQSQFLFIGNGGLNNNISYEFLEETFSKYGPITDIIMQKKKSYSFVIYEDETAASLATSSLHNSEITQNQTPIFFYIFPVDRVPDLSLDSGYREVVNKPDGLIYLDNFITESYATEIEDFITKNNEDSENQEVNLKKRRVKHYGYDFRYGTSDCDETKPLTDPANRMPVILNDLFEKMLNEKLIHVIPDQMTVNFYEPGQGIPPHTDNTTAFDEYIISLSLKSSVQMEFRQNGSKKFSKFVLKPNSLLVLKGDVRYNWAHLIAERKHDLIANENGISTVKKREKRISLTFRKVKSDGGQKPVDKSNIEMLLPKNETEAIEFERAHVHEVYNGIADHFSSTRHSAWPGVAKFIESMDAYSSMLDIGCGNGKYLNIRNDLFCFGCDYSDQLIKICQERNFNSFVSDCLCVPTKDNYFDYVISIAVLHHLSTMERRAKMLNEMVRVLKPGGKALVTVWAKEQKYKDKESFYISSKNSKSTADAGKIPKQKIKIPETSEEKKNNPLCHKFGKEFQKQDLFVAWNYSNTGQKKSKKNKAEIEVNSEDVKPAEEKVFLRFYHVFENQELENLFSHVPNARVIESYYEQGNWCAIFQKI